MATATFTTEPLERSDPRALGKYEILEKLGTGSFATVWLARKRDEEELVALKTISRERLEKTRRNKVRSNLESEMAILRHFKHPHLVSLVEINKCTDYVYIALEYMRGGDLQKLIRVRKRLNEEISRRFMGHLASGLEFLWSKNLIHRDLKPSNLLLTSNDERIALLKIADFGFARRLESAALADTLCGSPLYMAPEILTGNAYDGKADVWSVGTILYEMLSGQPPFTGQDHRDLLRNISTTTLRLPKDLILSPPCLELLKRLLRRDPIERIPIERFAKHRWLLMTSSEEDAPKSKANIDISIKNDIPPHNKDQSLKKVKQNLFGLPNTTTSSQLTTTTEDIHEDTDDDDYINQFSKQQQQDTEDTEEKNQQTTSSGEFVVVDHVQPTQTTITPKHRHKRRTLALAYAEEAVACASTLARVADALAKKKKWLDSLAVYASALRIARRAVTAAHQALQRSDGTTTPGGRARALEQFATEQLRIVLDRTIAARSKCEQGTMLPNAERLVFQRALILARSAAAKETLSQYEAAHIFYADASRCLAALLFSFLLSDSDRNAILAIIRGPLERALERTSQQNFFTSSPDSHQDNDDDERNRTSEDYNRPRYDETSSQLDDTKMSFLDSAGGSSPSNTQQFFVGDGDNK